MIAVWDRTLPRSTISPFAASIRNIHPGSVTGDKNLTLDTLAGGGSPNHSRDAADAAGRTRHAAEGRIVRARLAWDRRRRARGRPAPVDRAPAQNPVPRLEAFIAGVAGPTDHRELLETGLRQPTPRVRLKLLDPEVENIVRASESPMARNRRRSNA